MWSGVETQTASTSLPSSSSKRRQSTNVRASGKRTAAPLRWLASTSHRATMRTLSALATLPRSLAPIPPTPMLATFRSSPGWRGRLASGARRVNVAPSAPAPFKN